MTCVPRRECGSHRASHLLLKPLRMALWLYFPAFLPCFTSVTCLVVGFQPYDGPTPHPYRPTSTQSLRADLDRFLHGYAYLARITRDGRDSAVQRQASKKHQPPMRGIDICREGYLAMHCLGRIRAYDQPLPLPRARPTYIYVMQE